MLVLLVSLLFLSNPTLSQSSKDNDTNILQQLSDSLQSLTDRVCPAVVKLEISTYGTDVDDDDDSAENAQETTGILKQHVVGSGVIVDPVGYIVTNAHVVRDAKRIRAIVNPSGGSHRAARDILRGVAPKYEATLVGVDRDTDLAVLKISAPRLPALSLAPYEELRQGQLVLAVGSSLGMHNAVSMGVVSSIARQPDPEYPVLYIQTDALIEPGNSGGPLVDTKGDLVGINTLLVDGESGGFAVPSNTVKFVYEQIRKYGRVRHGDFGVRAQAITPTLALGLGLPSGWGVIISDVRPGSPADRAGLRPRDILTTFDGRTLETLPEFETGLYLKAPGDEVEIKALRGKDVINTVVRIEERTDEPDPISRPKDVEKSLIAEFGVFGVTVDQNLSKSLPGIRKASGVLISGKTKRAERLEIHLQPGDIIHVLNNAVISDMTSLRAEIKRLKPGDAVVLQVERKRKLHYVTFEID
jgi:serine protease Do